MEIVINERSVADAVVGILANPASGRDVRRLVAQASVYPIAEKCNVIFRLLSGLRAAGVGQVVMMPDRAGLAERVRRAVAANRSPELWPDVFFVDMAVEDGPEDTVLAAERMIASGVAVIVVIGGDGTHRLVATVRGDTPILALCSGTNNMFPQLREGTIAGIAAGLFATGKVSKREATRRNKVLNIQVDGEHRDLALVDVAVSSELWIGSKALWRSDMLTQLFVTFAEPSAMGLSSIAGLLQLVSRDAEYGLRLDLAPAGTAVITVKAPLAPGLIVPVGVSRVCEILPGQTHCLNEPRGVIALDGEREIEIKPDQRLTVRLELEGPYTIDVDRVMAIAAREGLLVARHLDRMKESVAYAAQQS
jgi:predicted polyphosphate/ATP-dependent NAD kinase